MKIVTLTPDKNDERFTITDDSSSTSFETGKSSTDFPSFPGSGVECRKRMRREADNQCMKFLENFDPDRSNREKRKMTQKIEVGSGLGISGGRVYDERGVHIATGLDVCDCMSDGCPGCRSNK
ncbi:ARL14 effector protein-like [Bacillus rossius redtenbacheri]|uniref:ARL14 effector protein-like n=1 Tax=Bacillus rossius redtenbacheri TaxID=93214 RepID=UPI002FDD732E